MKTEEKEEMLAVLNQLAEGTLAETLGIRFIDGSEGELVSSMEVTDAVRQPYGLLHGGASLAMGETTASFLSGWEVMKEGKSAVGISLEAQHHRPVRGGLVICRAVLERKEKNRHECRMEIRDGRGRLICTLHMINAVLERKRDVGSEEQ
ncbi:MAG TPA: thioesterase [Veillonellaceae bacterium]|nr:thioesterase [Veillonellaceae bacterium]